MNPSAVIKNFIADKLASAGYTLQDLEQGLATMNTAEGVLKVASMTSLFHHPTSPQASNSFGGVGKYHALRGMKGSARRDAFLAIVKEKKAADINPFSSLVGSGVNALSNSIVPLVGGVGIGSGLLLDKIDGSVSNMNDRLGEQRKKITILRSLKQKLEREYGLDQPNQPQKPKEEGRKLR